MKKTINGKEYDLSPGADLSHADLRGADLSHADLRGANLRGANLRGADLSHADLRGANLRGVNLRGADLYGANLRGVNLRGVDLYGANLRGVNLRGVNLRGAKNIFCMGPSVTGRIWYIVRHDEGPMILAGCRWFTLAEAREHWGDCRSDWSIEITQGHPRETINIQRLQWVDFIEQQAKFLGWI